MIWIVIISVLKYKAHRIQSQFYLLELSFKWFMRNNPFWCACRSESIRMIMRVPYFLVVFYLAIFFDRWKYGNVSMDSKLNRVFDIFLHQHWMLSIATMMSKSTIPLAPVENPTKISDFFIWNIFFEIRSYQISTKITWKYIHWDLINFLIWDA